ncbi:helix-turn-helix domain-containing protein [Streptomyces sp. NPDC058758]|uniref:helix-turn-helix domain-containing protein n=1 Tax=Streptomyces sp. NPDC058758 TaxID=3346627 RepID=UPI0036AC9BCC
MPAPEHDHAGKRIAEQCKLARLTQRELAGRIPYSYSWLPQVEGGARPASVDFTAAVARALRIDVTVLAGQPCVTQLQEDRLAELIRPIRESLDLYDLGDDPEVTTRPAAELTDDDELCAQVRATHLQAAAAALPDVITELTVLCWRAPATELWRALASAYRSAHGVMVKLGFFDLASVALDRLGKVPDSEGLGADFFLGVPATSVTAPDPRFRAWWVVPMDGPATLCFPAAVAGLVQHGRSRLTAAQA